MKEQKKQAEDSTVTSYKISPSLRRRLQRVTRIAASFGVQAADIVNAARTLPRRTLPAQESQVAKVLRRLTRQDRIAVNAVAGTRAMTKDSHGIMSPKPLWHGHWA